MNESTRATTQKGDIPGTPNTTAPSEIAGVSPFCAPRSQPFPPRTQPQSDTVTQESKLSTRLALIALLSSALFAQTTAPGAFF